MGKKTKPRADATILEPDVVPPPAATVLENPVPDSPPDATVLEPDITAPPGAALPADAEAVRSAEDRVAAEWEVGDVIFDLYEVKHIHTGGAMGVVYRVRHRGWNMDLAVKSPRPDFFATEAHKANFVRECETWIGLGLHPHTVSCHYVRMLGGMPRVFAEYIEGGSLSDWIESGKLYEGGKDAALERILDVAIQFAWGLGYAHEQELIHQDIKPANLMLTPEGVAKVTDFGLAQARPLDEVELANSAGGTVLIKGRGMTPAYCSPEQAAGAELSRKTDIWSWAVSLLEMFTGELTWVGGQLAAAALQGYLQVGVDEKDIPDMPPQIVDLLRHCFKADPAERPNDMAEVVEALLGAYPEVTSEPYPRPTPNAAELLADGLNNRAVSLVDLGRIEEAEALLTDAIKSDPHHPEAVFNRGLVQWRSGRLADDALVTQLEEVRLSHEAGWRDEYLLGLVHMERGDAEAAIEVLEEASALAPDQTEIQRALTTARSARGKWRSCLRTFEGHSAEVTSVSLSPDGHRALSGSKDKTLRLWELATGRCVRTVKTYGDEVLAVSLSPDGRWALSGNWNSTLRLWELATGRQVRTYHGHANTSFVRSVSISPDGLWVLSGSGGIKSPDNVLRLYKLATSHCVRTFKGHKWSVDSVNFSPDGRWVLSGSRDSTLRLWELATGRCVRIFEGHSGRVRSVCFSQDGRWVLSGSDDATLRLWELETGKCVRTFEGHADDVNSVNFSPDGRWALSGSKDKTLRLWELATGRCVRTFEGHADDVNSVNFSPDGRWVLSGSGSYRNSDNTLRLWAVKDTTPVAAFAIALPRTAADVTRLAITVNEATEKARSALRSGLVSDAAVEVAAARRLPGYERDTDLLELWREVGQHGVRASLSGCWFRRTLEGHTGGVNSVSISPDGRWALSGSHDETIRLWDLATGQCVRTLRGHKKVVFAVSCSPDGRWALSGSGGGTLRLWELATGRCVLTFRGHTGIVRSVSFSPDGRWALSGSSDMTMRLWELSTGQCVRTFEGHKDYVSSVSFSPDGRWALSGSGGYTRDDNTLRLWELATGRCVRIFEGHTKWVISVSFSPDGRQVMSGSVDGTMRLWELDTGRCVRAFEGHTEGMYSVSFSPDGRWALSGSHDKTLRLWELTTGKCVRTFEGHTEEVKTVTISPDGRWVLSSGWRIFRSSGNTLRLWDLDWEYEFPEPRDWDEGARPYLEIFLARHTPYAKVLPQKKKLSQRAIRLALTRSGKPAWTEKDFERLLETLGAAGYGWLRPEGVRNQLKEMAASSQGPLVPPHTLVALD